MKPMHCWLCSLATDARSDASLASWSLWTKATYAAASSHVPSHVPSWQLSPLTNGDCTTTPRTLMASHTEVLNRDHMVVVIGLSPTFLPMVTTTVCCMSILDH